MPGISQDFVKGLIKNGYGYMFETYDEKEETWPQYIKERKVDGDFWQETSVINSGTWRKTAEAEPFQPQTVVEGFTVYARVFDYTQAVTLTRNVVNDHQKIKDLMKGIANGWGVTAKDTREEFYARIFNQGGMTAGDWIFNGTPESQAVTDSSGNKVYDSAPFFNLSNNTRTSKGGATYYNGFALDLNADNLETVYSYIVGTNNRRENDTQMQLKPDTLLVPQGLEMQAKKIINSTLVPFLSTNTTNVLSGLLNIVCNSYLTDTDAWFVGQKYMGIEALTRQEPVIDFFEDKKNRCFWATAEMRIGVMVRNWRFWAGSNFATS